MNERASNSAVDAGLDHAFVVPAYGQSPYLIECLESLNRQKLASPIHISTSTPFPGLEAIAERHGARLFVHHPNRGIGHDWNRALSCTNAQWTTLVHQDDLYLPDFTTGLARTCRARDDVIIAFTNYHEVDQHSALRPSSVTSIKRFLLEAGFLGRQSVSTTFAKTLPLRFGNPIACPTVTFNRSAIGSFEFRTDMRSNIDWAAWIDLARRKGHFLWIREPLVHHRVHSTSETSTTIVGGERAAEDRAILDALWPRPLAALLFQVYKLAYRNRRGAL